MIAKKKRINQHYLRLHTNKKFHCIKVYFKSHLSNKFLFISLTEHNWVELNNINYTEWIGWYHDTWHSDTIYV
jgi:hypothetical protein